MLFDSLWRGRFSSGTAGGHTPPPSLKLSKAACLTAAPVGLKTDHTVLLTSEHVASPSAISNSIHHLQFGDVHAQPNPWYRGITVHGSNFGFPRNYHKTAWVFKIYVIIIHHLRSQSLWKTLDFLHMLGLRISGFLHHFGHLALLGSESPCSANSHS